MIDSIIRYSLRNRLLILAAVVGLLVGGYLALERLPVDAYPDAAPAMVQVFTRSPGLSPVDVETLLTYPIESAMYGLPQLERVQSTSIFGLSRVQVYFEDGTDIYFARRLVNERLAEARRQIPSGLGDPELGPITSSLGRILMYTVANQGDADYSLNERRTYQDWIVKPQLRTVPDVTGILSLGGHQRQYQVNMDAQALRARDLAVSDVRRALMENNRNVGASFINRGGEEFIVRGLGWVSSGEQGLADIRNMIVAERSGNPVHVSDIATVEYGPAIRRGAQITNGEETAGGYVFQLIGANTRQVLEDVNARIEQINDSLPEGLAVEPYYSQASITDQAINTVQQALLLGAMLILLVLYLFISNLRATLIVISSVPLAVLVAFIAMWFSGLSANLMSLGGLAIGIGMMVDGSIVVMENVSRHLETRRDEDIAMPLLVGQAVREVARPIVFAVGIVIIVFLPLFTLQGMEGKLFSPMAYTISFALGGALLMALTVVPVLASLVFNRGSQTGQPRLVEWLKARYRPVLAMAVKHPRGIFGGAAVLFLASLTLFPFLGTEFIPTLREGTFKVRSTLPPAASLDSAIEYSERIQTVLREFPEVTGTYSRVGRAEVGGDPEPVNVVATTISLKPLDEWQSGRDYEELQTTMAETVGERIPGLANNFSQPIQLRTNHLLSGIQAELVVSIFGDDLAELEQLGQQVESLANNVEGATDVRMQQQGGKRQIVVEPDRAALAGFGINVDTVMETLETGVGGQQAGLVFDGIRRFEIFVRLQASQRDRLDLIRELPLRTGDGALIPLSRVADVRTHTGPKMISRANNQRRLYVQMNVRGRDMGSVVEELRNRIDSQVEMPPGYFVDFGGQFENQQRAMQRLYLVVPITLGLIFLMLFSAFNSLRYATLIFLNVPFAIIGGILALFLSGLYLSVPAAVGFIAVFGVAVQNGVVMVSYINQLRERGHDMTDAILTGAEHRLRPVLMTALTAILGLLPLLLAGGLGANVQRPLAAVVVGGLITSTLLTLLVLPSVYRWFAEPRQEREI